MTLPFGLLDPSASLLRMPQPPTDAIMTPPPYARKPSIVDRIAARLFPSGAYQGLLDPGTQQGLQRQGLLSLGANLLAGGGASPQQHGTLANIGMALQQSQAGYPEMAQRALALQAYKKQQEGQQAITDVMSQQTPGQSTYDSVAQAMQKLITLGPEGIRAAAALAPVADALKAKQPGNAQEISGVVDTRLGSPTLGQSGTFLIPYPGAPKDQWTFVKGKPERDVGGQMTATQRTKYGEQAEYGAAALAAWQPVERIRTRNPGVEAEVGKIMSAPSFIQAIPGFHSADDAVLALKKAGASADAQQYMRAKINWMAQIERTMYTGARGITSTLLKQFNQQFTPGLDELGNAQMRQNELQAMATAYGNAGADEHPEFWTRAAKRHGVSQISIEKLLSGGSLDDRLNDIRDRYK